MKATNRWRLVQGLAASLLIAGALAAGIPFPNSECAICRANFPEWVCYWPCWFQ